MTYPHHIPLHDNSNRIGPNDASTPSPLLQEPVIWKLLLLSAIACIVWGEQINIVLGPISIASAENMEFAELSHARAALFAAAADRSIRPTASICGWLCRPAA